jgi:uncharacterized protein
MRKEIQMPKKSRRKSRKRAALVFLTLFGGLIVLDLILPPRFTTKVLARPLIMLYRAGPGRLLGHPCPSHPSCSAYALEAYGKHGLILGTLLTADRLMAEQGRMEEGPWVWIKGRKYVDDPLVANTFWWSK